MQWMHLQIWFKNNADINKYPSECEYRKLMDYLEQVTLVQKTYSSGKKFFFLFEPNPHLFLAMEVPDYNQSDIAMRIDNIPRPSMIRKTRFAYNTKDVDHMTNLLYEGAKFAFYKSRHKMDYFKGDEAKVIHCLCNQWLITYLEEYRLYAKRCKEIFGKRDNPND